MQKLVEGIHRFQSNQFDEDRALFEDLAGGQNPICLFITCSDSRIDPNLLTQTKPGDLFIQRTAGNIVPPYGAVAGGEAATIEYAVAALGVEDIVICGHSHCGAMGGLLKPEATTQLPAVRAYLEHAAATARIVSENYGEVSDDAAKLSVAVQENVLVQLENLKTHPTVAAALGRGALKLHGWVYRFETGEVFTFDPDEGQFVALADDLKPAGAGSRTLASV